LHFPLEERRIFASAWFGTFMMLSRTTSCWSWIHLKLDGML